MLKEYFLNKVKEIYPCNFSKYDYSLVPNNFKSMDKIAIKCLLHGVFYQRCNHHLNNHGCRKCSTDKNTDKKRHSIKSFIKKAINIHGNIYCYKKLDYKDSKTKVNINCVKHGSYWQTPGNHLAGKGCVKCAIEESAKRRTCSREDFITKAILIHGDKYNYDKLIYTNSNAKVIITCPTHGDFKQTPPNHLKHNGCPRCRESYGELFISNILDKLNVKYIKEYKIQPYNYRYDFYLPEYDIYIEYNGIQHYEIRKVFGGEKGFKKTIRNDKAKKEIIKRSTGLLIVLKYTFDTLSKIEDELLRLFNVLHVKFLTDKELTKQIIFDSKIFLINKGIAYFR